MMLITSVIMFRYYNLNKVSYEVMYMHPNMGKHNLHVYNLSRSTYVKMGMYLHKSHLKTQTVAK
jgi:hypothetical protein